MPVPVYSRDFREVTIGQGRSSFASDAETRMLYRNAHIALKVGLISRPPWTPSKVIRWPAVGEDIRRRKSKKTGSGLLFSVKCPAGQNDLAVFKSQFAGRTHFQGSQSRRRKKHSSCRPMREVFCYYCLMYQMILCLRQVKVTAINRIKSDNYLALGVTTRTFLPHSDVIRSSPGHYYARMASGFFRLRPYAAAITPRHQAFPERLGSFSAAHAVDKRRSRIRPESRPLHHPAHVHQRCHVPLPAGTLVDRFAERRRR